MSEKLLEIKNLHVMYKTDEDDVYACRIGLPLLCQRPEPFRFQENQDAANDKCNTAERVPPWHNIDLPTKSNGLCGKQADAR